jgi:SulP family sulfate permease
MAAIQRIVRSIPDLLVPFFARQGFVYSWGDIRADMLSGITVALIQIPQSMAFALTAGLPAVYGLYASIPGCIASLWGSSRQLSTGPVAVVSLLTLTSLVPLAAPGTAEFAGLAALLAILVGCIYFLMGILRLGFFLHFVPQSVVVGFSSAAAIIIVITQIPNFIGISIPQHELVFENIAGLLLNLPRASLITTLVGMLSVGLLFAAKKLPKVFPGALVVLVASVIAGYVLHLDTRGVALIQHIPSSLPMFTFPLLSIVSLFSLFPKAAIIALVAFVQTNASARIAARKTKEELNINQELVGQGLANFVTGFFQGFPVSGSLTRTAVNVEAGARTGISTVVASCMTILSLLFLTPFFFFLPKTVLAGIVIVAALPLIEFGRLREMLRISPMDGYVAYITFAMAFILKPDDAIFIGIVAALILFLQRTTFGAKAFEMGADKEWNVLRAAIQEERVDTFSGVCIVRVGMSFYYANAVHLVEQIEEVMAAHATREKTQVHTLVLDSSGINFVDITASEILSDFLERLHERGIHIAVIYLRTGFRQALETMPGKFSVTVLHNIQELKQYCLPQHRTLVLSGTQPETIQRKMILYP